MHQTILMEALLQLMAAGWEDSFLISNQTRILYCRHDNYLKHFYLLIAKIKKATTATETPT